MDEYLNRLNDLIDTINTDQKHYLVANVKDEVLQSIVDTSTFNNAYIDATRNIKTILTQSAREIKMTIDHYNKPV